MQLASEVRARIGTFESVNRAKIVAGQFQALLDRNHLTISEFCKKYAKHGWDPVAPRRVLKGAAKTEPEPETLRRLALVVDEKKEFAFPENASATPPAPEPPSRIQRALKSVADLPPELIDQIAEYAEFVATKYEQSEEAQKKKRELRERKKPK